jgi:DNA-binding NtrC family response regulator
MSLAQTMPITSAEAAAANGDKHLLIMGPELFLIYQLPLEGSLEIGRSETAHVRLDDPMVSRRHATLHVGLTSTVEDHGSVNGTLLRGAPVPQGVRAPVQPGEGIAIGPFILMIQTRRAPLHARRIWPHVYFEGRVEDECERARAAAGALAIVRLRLASGASPDDVAARLDPLLKWGDAIAKYGPEDYEILLATRPAPALEADVEALLLAIEEGRLATGTGVAAYPEDGQTADALFGVVADRLRGAGAAEVEPDGAVVQDAAMKALYDLARRAAASDINVLVLGETGVGKDVLARAIHRASPRAAGPFLSLNCAAFTETLLESELFGHERGAFTGAVAPKPGLFESADGGTVFLDEVGELPLTMQPKLLRVLETREVTRVGALKPRSVDVRFVAATNRDLEVEVEKGAFRRDLYFRLNALSLSIPPLRARTGEIVPLATRFIAESCRRLGRTPPGISPEAVDLLERYVWPGNIRELRNFVDRALVLCGGSQIRTEHLPVERMQVVIPRVPAPVPLAAPAAAEAEAAEDPGERQRILDALATCAGNQTRAARLIGMSRRTFLRRLERYGIARPLKGGGADDE